MISGSGSLTKTGTGTLTLTGANTYSGTTTISEGTLALGATNSLSSASLVTLDNVAGAQLNLSGFGQAIGGLSGGGALGGNVALGAGTLTVQQGADSTYAGVISGTGGLTKSGTGTLTLSGANTYSGTTTVSAGMLAVSANNNLGSSTLTVNGGTLNTTASFTSNHTVSLGASGGTFSTDASTTLTQTGIISGTGSLTKTGSGVLLLSGVNTYTGSTTISAGTLQVGGTSALSTTSSVALANTAGATLDLGGNSITINGLSGGGTTGGDITLGANTLTVQNTANTTYAGIISGTGGFTKTGTGTLTLSGANTYTGTTTINGGTLQVGGTSVLSTTSSVALANTAGATLDLGGNSITINGLTGGGTTGGNITLGSGTLTVQNTANTTYAGIISGAGGLTKNGTGTLTLSGVNTYTGATNINAGSLTLGNANVLATSSGVTFANMAGAVLNLNNNSQTIKGLSGGGTTGGNIILGSGTLTVQNTANTAYAGVISGTGGLTKSGTGTLTLSGANTYTGATNINAGTLQVGGVNALSTTSSVALANIAGAALDLNNNSITIKGLSGGGTTGGNIILGSGTLTVQNTANTTYAGVISGTGGFTKNGTGTLTLSGVNTYTGATTVNAGTLTTGSANVLATSSGVTLANVAGATLNLNNNSQTIKGLSGGGTTGGNITLGSGTLTVQNTTSTSYAGVISGTGGLTKTGAGTLTLSGANTYSGATTVSAGVLAISANNNLGTSTLTLNGGTLNTTASFTSTHNVALGASGGTFNTNSSTTLTQTGIISGTGALTKSGSGVLLLSSANTYTGATTISGGTLRLGTNSALASTTSVTLSNVTNAQLDLNGYNQTIGGLSGGGAVGGNVSLGAGTLTVQSASNTTYAGVISGTGGLTKSSTGTLTLTGVNTYSGATTINAGTISIAADTALGTGSLTLNGGTLYNTAAVSSTRNVALGASGGTLSTGAALSLSGVISGTGALTKTGTGTLTLSGANTYTGATTINAGTLTLVSANALTTSSGVTLANVAGATLNLNGYSQTIKGLSGGGTTGGNVTLGSGTLTVQNAASTTYAGVISGSGGFTKSGAGTLTLSRASTYTGATTINAGTLTLGIANALASSSEVSLANVAGATLNLNGYSQTIKGLSGGGTTGGNITLGAGTLTVQNTANTTYAGVVSGTGGFTKSGAGTLTLSGANTYTGATTISAGTLQVGGASALSTTSSVVLANTAGAVLDLNGFNQTIRGLSGGGTTGGNITLGAGTLTVQNTANTTYAGVISGTGGLTKSGAGTLTLSGSNTYTGATSISTGTLSLGSANALTSSSGVTLANVAGATLNLNGYSQTIQGLSGGGTTGGNVTLGAGTLTVQNTANTTYAGVISGTGGLTKSGAGTLTLSRASTYTGATTINAGTLTLGVANALATSSGVTLANVAGATLNLNGYSQTIKGLSGGGTTGGNIALGAGTLTVQNTANSTYAGVISGTGGFTKSGAGTLTLSGANTYTGATNISGGTLQVGGASALSTTSTVALANTVGAVLDLNGFNQTIKGLSGGGTTGGNIALGAGTLTVQNTANTTYAGVISGTGGFTKSGAGTLTLSGANTYTGATTINAGTLTLGNASALTSTSGVTLANVAGASLNLNGFSQTIQGLSGGGATGGNIALGAGTLTVQNTANTTYAGVISGTGGFTKSGAGTLTLSRANTYTGATTINAGTLTLGIASALTSTSGVTLANVAGASLNLNGFSQTIQGLSGGGTTGGNIALGAGTLTVQNTANTTYAGVISGSGGFTKSGAGTLTLSGANTYTGATNISTGTLTLGSANALASSSGVTLANVAGASLNLNGYSQTIKGLSGGGTNGGNIALGSGTLTVQNTANTTYAGVISGTGGFTKSGAATLTLSRTSTYTGATTINAGTLTLGIANALASSSEVTLANVAGASLNLNGFSQTIKGLSGGGTTGGNIALGAGTLTVQNTANTTYAGVISGTGGFTKSGSGTLTLSGANTYTGATTISTGTLQMGGASALASTSSVALVNTAGAVLDLNGYSITIKGLSGGGTTGGNITLGTGTLTVQNTAATTYTGVISGTGGFTKSGTATLTLSGANTYTGATTINAGTLTMGISNALAASSGVTLANVAGAALNLNGYSQIIQGLSGGGTTGGSIALGSGTLTVQNATNSTYAGVISGTGGLTKNGTGTLTLSGANTYTGSTTINAGTISIAATTGIGAGVLTLNGGTLNTTVSFSSLHSVSLGVSGGTIDTNGSTTLTQSGVVSGTGALTKTGAGTLTLAGVNTYSGGTTINAGTISIAADNRLGAGALTLNGGTLNNTATFSTSRAVSLGASGGSFSTDAATTLTETGVISGSGGLTKSGTGILVLSGANTYSGATSVTSGILRMGAANSFSSVSSVSLANTAGVQLDLNNFSQTIGGLSGGGASGGNVSLGSALLTVQSSLNTTYAGVISGTGGLTKNGSGTLALTAINTLSGPITVTGGSLAVNSDSALGTGSLTLNGGTLENTTTFSISRALSLGTSGGTINTDPATTLTLSGVLSGTGSLTKTGTGTLALTGTNTYTGGTYLNAGTVNASSWASVGGVNNPLVYNGGTLLVAGVNPLESGTTVGTGGVTFNTSTGNVTVTGVLSGVGPVIKTGSGTLYLTGINTYQGGTILNGGVVNIASGASLGTGPITFNGCTLQFASTTTLENSVSLNSNDGAFDTNGNDATINGSISGGGSLTKIGAGTLYLRGFNGYLGKTNINGGVLNIISDTNLGSPSAGVTLDGGTLQISADVSSSRTFTLNSGGGSFDTNGSTLTLNGEVTGTGMLTKTGAGTLVLNGNNSYSGGTSINAGTLAIVSDSNLGASSGMLTFNGGTLLTNAALTTARSFFVGSGGGTLDNGGNAVTLSGQLSGNGAFTFAGNGTTTFSGSGSGYTGQALLASGMLKVLSSSALGGTLTTSVGATVGGYGTLGNLNNNGMVSPGGSIGTLNVAGDFLQGSSGIYLNEIDPSGKGDLLNVSGRAQLNGGLLIVSAPIAYYPTGASWPTILAAGGQTGAFAAAIQDFPSLILKFLPVSTPAGTLTVAYRNPYGAFAANSRAASAGAGLNRGAYAATGTFANDILAMDLAPQASIASSLNQMHPEPYDAFTQTGFDDGRLVTSSIQGRMHSLRKGEIQEAFVSPFDVAPTGVMAFNEIKQGNPFAASLDSNNRWGVFFQPFGMTGRQGSDGGRTGYGFNSWGMLGGMDYTFSKNFSAGLFGGYSGRNLTLSAPASGSGRTDTASFGGFATWSGKNWFVEGSVRGGVDSYQAKRTISSPTGSLRASSSWNGWNLFANIGAGYDWRFSGWVLSPIGSVDFARIAQNGYDESGGGSLGLTMHPRSDSSLRTSLGIKVARPMEYQWGVLIPEIRMTWGHEWLNSSRDITANFQGSAASNFTTKSVPPPSDWASLSAALTVKRSERFSASVRISTDLFRKDYNALAGSLSVRYSF